MLPGAPDVVVGAGNALGFACVARVTQHRIAGRTVEIEWPATGSPVPLKASGEPYRRIPCWMRAGFERAVAREHAEVFRFRANIMGERWAQREGRKIAAKRASRRGKG